MSHDGNTQNMGDTAITPARYRKGVFFDYVPELTEPAVES